MEYGTDGDDRYIYLGSRLLAKTVNASTELFRDGFESTSLNEVTGSGPDTWYLTDHLGSSIATADAAGNILERSQFAPFGERWLKPPERGPGYAGHFEDGTNLTYMKARYYSAAGQFLSVDPVDVDTNHGTNFNRYWYANNCPTGFLDSDGKWGHRSDVPWYDFTGQVGNWFSELQDISADRAFGSNAAGPEALEQHAWKAGMWVVSVQTLALPEAGGTALANARFPMAALATSPSVGAPAVELALLQATTKATPQVALNKIAGDAFRDRLAQFFISQGRQVQIEVVKWTPFGKRVIDLEVSQNGKVLGGIEAKTGSSRYTTLQQLKDWWLRNVENYPVDLVRAPK